MSQTLQNQLLLAKSMNGIISFSDGAGTTISNGQILTTDISSNTLATGNMTLNGVLDLNNSLELEQYDNLSTAVGLVSLWEKGHSYFTYLPQSSATPSNTTDLITLGYYNSNTVSLSGTNNWTGQNTFSKLTYSNITSSIAITNYNFSTPAYSANTVNLLYFSNGTYTGLSGWTFTTSNPGTSVYEVDIVNGTTAYNNLPPPSTSGQALMMRNYTYNSYAYAKSASLSLVAGEYILSIQATSRSGVNGLLDMTLQNTIAYTFGGLYSINPSPDFPNWITYSVAISVPTATNAVIVFNYKNTDTGGNPNDLLITNVSLVLENAILVSDGVNTSYIGGSVSLLNNVNIYNKLNVVTGGASIVGGLTSSTNYGSNNTTLNTTMGSLISTNNSNNVILGNGSFQGASTSNRNIGIGAACNSFSTSNNDCVAIGYNTGLGGNQNQSILIGSNIQGIGNAANNILMGFNTNNQNSLLSYNCLIGTQIAQLGNPYGSLNGSYNTALGNYTLQQSSDYYNTAIGCYALQNMYGTNGETQFGIFPGYTTQYNVAIGYNSGQIRQRYNKCTFLGANTDTSVDNLTNVVCVGYGTTCGISNTIQLGSNSEVVAISGNLKAGANTITPTQLGYLSPVSGGICDLGTDQTITGKKTITGALVSRLFFPIPASSMNLASLGLATTYGIGINCMANFAANGIILDCIGIGKDVFATGTNVSSCIAIGTSSQTAMTNGAISNVSIGNRSLKTGTINTQCSTYGEESLYNCTGNTNTAIGYRAGYNFASYTNCTFVGALADASSNTISQSTAIGYNSRITASNQVVLGTTTETTIIPSTKIQYGGSYQPNSVFQTIIATNVNWNTTPPTILPHYILFSAAGAATTVLTLPAISNANIFEGIEFIFRRTNTTASATTTSLLSATSVGTDVIYPLSSMISITSAAQAIILNNGGFYGKIVCVNKTTTPYAWAVFPS